jgi:hypothetical protein
VPLIKTTVVEQKKKKKVEVTKGRRSAKEIQEAKNAKLDNEPKTVETHAGTIQIEINLQRGDTEEELERNY